MWSISGRVFVLIYHDHMVTLSDVGFLQNHLNRIPRPSCMLAQLPSVWVWKIYMEAGNSGFLFVFFSYSSTRLPTHNTLVTKSVCRGGPLPTRKAVILAMLSMSQQDSNCLLGSSIRSQAESPKIPPNFDASHKSQVVLPGLLGYKLGFL